MTVSAALSPVRPAPAISGIWTAARCRGPPEAHSHRQRPAWGPNRLDLLVQAGGALGRFRGELPHQPLRPATPGVLSCIGYGLTSRFQCLARLPAAAGRLPAQLLRAVDLVPNTGATSRRR